jgi:hypothetical protein
LKSHILNDDNKLFFGQGLSPKTIIIEALAPVSFSLAIYFPPALKNTLDKVKVGAILNCYAIFEAPLAPLRTRREHEGILLRFRILLLFISLNRAA